MIDIDHLRRMFDEASTEVTVPEDAPVLLEGSLAEGFGNEASDLDCLVVVEPTFRGTAAHHVTFVEGRRLEIYYRTEREIGELARRVNAATPDRPAGALRPRDLDLYQRFARGCALRGAERVRELQAQFDLQHLGRLAAHHFASIAAEAHRCCSALLHLGALDDAVAWAGTMVYAAAKRWAAQHGETYISLKWLSLQLTRAGAPADVTSTFARLWNPPREPRDRAAYVRSCLAATKSVFDLALPSYDAQDIFIRAVGRRTAHWELGGESYVVRSPGDVFAVTKFGAAVFHAIGSGVSLAELPARLGSLDVERARVAARDFQRAGLLAITWSDGAQRWAPRDGTPHFDRRRSPIAEPMDDAPPDVRMIPFPGHTIGAAGASMAWCNLKVEICREDARGAIAASDWHVAECALRKLAREAVNAWLSAHMVTPLPPEAEAIPRLSGTEIGAELYAEARALEYLVVRSRAEAEAAERRVATFVDAIRRNLRGAFPRGLDSAAEYALFEKQGAEWGRFASAMNVARAGRTRGLEYPVPFDKVGDALRDGSDASNTVEPEN